MEELAAKLKVPVSWIYDRTRLGGPEKIPHYKIGKYVRFSGHQVEQFLKRKDSDETSR
ncbi:MAG: helix-turn-helix domain-containing protein [candidate division Zixibacteria bacterium]|nr:helix-turn-helix domain-containing protein [candidate division Zixibacteria bacterium]